MAKNTGAEAKMAPLVFFHHLLETLPGENVPLVDEAVKELSTRLDYRHVGNLEAVLFCVRRRSASSTRRTAPLPLYLRGSTSRIISSASL